MMVPIKSQDQMLYLITALLRDVQTLHSEVISPESLRRNVAKVTTRVAMEGTGFLTKQLPRLGKAFDLALSGEARLVAVDHGFKPMEGSQLPLLLGELFQRVFANDGWILPDPCVSSIKSIRQVLFSFYKYQLPYSPETEAEVLSTFERTEEELTASNKEFGILADLLNACDYEERYKECRSIIYERVTPKIARSLIRKARLLLYDLFRHFNPHDIVPRHGPGAVSTRERLWNKFRWTRISPRLLEEYPLDAYFYASLDHVVDRVAEMQQIEMGEDSARVVLVPKDSRGPRVISCEPLPNQWIQQGLRRALYAHIERHPLTKDNVHFTDQGPNQLGALLGSITGQYATLDLKEASDRVSVGLVKLLFPGQLVSALMASRSLTTVLPSGKVLTLHKFAPMGSALCFPVLALVIWALLTAGAPDADTRERILVYGDDVIVPTGYAGRAIEILELFALKVNKSKSYIKGFFRESCGVDAYRGKDVTPVRFSTVMSLSRSPEVLSGWCEYANQFYENSYFYTYELIAGWLFQIYGPIPDLQLSQKECPYLLEVPDSMRPKTRWCSPLQRVQFQAWTIVPHTISAELIDGWSTMLRYVTFRCRSSSQDELCEEERLALFTQGLSPLSVNGSRRRSAEDHDLPFDTFGEPLSVCSYTRPRDTKLVQRWLPECRVKPARR